MFSKSLKFIPYYYGRYFGYSIAYGLLYGLLVIGPMILLGSILIGFIKTGWPIYLIIGLFVATVLFIFVKIHKDVLEEVFFKKYKRFSIVPKFEKITYWFTIKFMLAQTIIDHAISYVLELALIKIGIRDSEAIYELIKKFEYSFETPDLLWLIPFFASFVVEALVLKFFIERYATIESLKAES